MSKRILIVEDNVLLAMDLAQQLTSEGHKVVGPCATTQDAIEKFEQVGCEIALLDIDLGTETSERVAQRLAENHVPFIITSSHPVDKWPRSMQGNPSVPKPIETDALLALIDGPTH